MIEDFILRECLQFWNDLKLDKWPEPGKKDTEIVKKLFPNSNLVTIKGNDRYFKIAQNWKEWKEKEKEAKEEKEIYENVLKNYMKNAEKLEFEDGSYITWKQAKMTKYFNKKAFESQKPDIYNAYTEQKPGSRRFLSYLK